MDQNLTSEFPVAAYLKTTGPAIAGQATDSMHLDWIPVLSMRQSLDRPVYTEVGQATRFATTRFPSVLVVAKIGRHLPEMQVAAARGVCFEQVEIDFCQDIGSGKRDTYYRVLLSEVYITNMQVENVVLSEVADTLLMQLNYRSCEMTFALGDEKYHSYLDVGGGS